jgi:hypothetical protein
MRRPSRSSSTGGKATSRSHHGHGHGCGAAAPFCSTGRRGAHRERTATHLAVARKRSGGWDRRRPTRGATGDGQGRRRRRKRKERQTVARRLDRRSRGTQAAMELSLWPKNGERERGLGPYTRRRSGWGSRHPARGGRAAMAGDLGWTDGPARSNSIGCDLFKPFSNDLNGFDQ